MNRRVLVIDADPRVRAAVRELLATTRHLTVAAEASTAAEALRALRDDAVDVALVEVALPDPASGLALITALSQRVPVLAVSMSATHGGAAIAAGAAAFLDKGGDPDALLSALTDP